MLHGLLGLGVWGDIIATLLLTHITVVATTIYLHRCQAHRALELHPLVSHFFRFWLWLTTGTRTKEWVAIHRKHHAKCETSEDPHSPQILGLQKVFFEGAELYQAEAKNQETLTRYGDGTPNDWFERHIYTPWNGVGITIMFLLDIMLFGIPGITIWAVQMMWLPVFAAGVINGIGHYWGYRNYECPDAARNIVPWSIITAGEELHNNHHTFATSAKLSVKWWEVDLGWGYIRLLQLFKLAKIKRLPPKLIEEHNKTHIDLETLKAVVVNRFQVMANYSREVILPVLREERSKATATGQALLRRAKNLLTRTDSLIDDSGQQRIASLLAANQKLELVYQYRLRLQAIWNRTTASQKELLEALQQWCKEAESTGITVLHNFAARISGYRLERSTH